MAGPGNILIKIGAEAGQAIRELSTVDKALGSTMTTSEKMGAGIKKAALPAAAALGAIGYAAIGATKAAIEDAAAQDKLAGVLERTTGANEAAVAAVEDYITATSRATGVADDELRPAFEQLVTATGDVAKSQKYMSAALDISAASGKDMESVSKAIALAHTGQTAKLEKLVPGLSKAAKESDDMNVIMGELAKTTGGAMAASTETAAGQMKIMENQTAELQESLGAALLPVVTALIPLFSALADLAAENTGVVKILVAAIAALSAVILVVNAAMKIYGVYAALFITQTGGMTVAQRALNFAMTANPIGLVITALAALALGLFLAYKKSETFRDIVHGALDAVRGAVAALDRAFDALVNAARAAFDWIIDHWKLALFAFGPIGAAVYLIATNFDKVKAAADAAFGLIKRLIGPLIELVQDLVSALGKIKIPKLPGGLGGLNPFMVAPAPALAGVAPSAYARAPSSSSSSPGLTVNVYGAIDPEGTARAVRRLLERHDRRQGRRG